MRPRICICCGEAISEKVNPSSRHPHLCSCCSSLADGMEEVAPDAEAETNPQRAPRLPEPTHPDAAKSKPLPAVSGAEPPAEVSSLVRAQRE